ncbi:hypothetical protein RB2083_3738 [Rhodobacteraceae bacterium HTCC2083]|nr:hypothetical protein RB2083_3738 [Rhodobacteraceae bacterium HTCC2083]
MTMPNLLRKMPIAVPFSDAVTWNVSAQFAANWQWDEKDIHELGWALFPRREAALDYFSPDTEVTLLTIRFDGSIEPRDPTRICDVKGKLFRVHPGDVVFSKIDVRNGAIGIAPNDIKNMCVTSEFPVYIVNQDKTDPDYIKLLFRTDAFMKLLNSMISGASGRKRIQPSQLEKAKVPLPSNSAQVKVADYWRTGDVAKNALVLKLESLTRDLGKWMEGQTVDFTQSCKSRFFVAGYEATQQWDMKAGRAAHFLLSNPDFVRLGDYTEECTESVKPWDEPEKKFPVYGVNNKNGVFLNKYQTGNTFNAPYKRIEKNWFFHNPTRANVGSLGKVPQVSNEAITSPEYQVWRLTGGFLPEFMALLIRTDYFLSLVDFNRVGGVKQRMYYSNLADIRLPMVPLKEQQRVAEDYTKLLAEIAEARSDLKLRKLEIEKMILGTTKIEGN